MRIGIRALALSLSLGLVLYSGAALARNDIMPPPRKAPRLPVEAQLLKEQKEYEGKAKAVDGERLLVGDKEILLYGIVTPSLSSNYGPQSRLQLDQLLQGNVLCKVTDRDKEGRPIAFCGTVDTPDISYEMLRRGWAMVDRKAIKGSGVSDVYEKAEQDALTANKGIFAPQPMATVVPVTNPSRSVVVPAPNATAEIIPLAPKAVETKPAETKPVEIKPTPADNAVTSPPPAAAATQASPPPSPPTAPALQAQKNGSAMDITPVVQLGFVERYQQMISALVFLAAAVTFGYALRRREQNRLQEQRRALAAALRGELMAARHICRTKARELGTRRAAESDAPMKPSQLWPRVRSFVYQAHVGSIGLLGAELARQVASVYGQCADYAAYYQQTVMQRMPPAKAVSETLSNLADHIEMVLEHLSQVELTGNVFTPEPEITVDPVQEAEQAAAAVSVAASAPSSPPPSAPPAAPSMQQEDLNHHVGRLQELAEALKGGAHKQAPLSSPAKTSDATKAADPATVTRVA